MSTSLNPKEANSAPERDVTKSSPESAASPAEGQDKVSTGAKKKKKVRVVYYEDRGETLYSMAALNGKTPEEQEEYDKKRKNFVRLSAKEKRAAILAAFQVYGPPFLCLIGAFTLAALLLYFFLK
ncbi:MAG: hypothetical protein IJY18_05205 [Clostridia bacterium]|nr:hypothetical protein [Clostridia bacterium]